MALLLAGTVLCFAGAGRLLAAEPETAAALHALEYVRAQQRSDGGFTSGYAPGSDPGSTIDAVLAFAAAGIDPKSVEKDGQSPDDYLAAQATAYSANAGAIAKLALGVAAMDLDASAFGGIDLIALMDGEYDAATGVYGGDTFAQANFILANVALGQTVPQAAVGYLKSLRLADGGWKYCCTADSDTNSTALALRSLIAGGVDAGNAVVQAGLAYIKANQGSDGGIGYCCSSSGGDANSTAYGIQALVAAGENIDAGGSWDMGSGATPLSALLSYQNVDTGALLFLNFSTNELEDNALATYQGVPGLMLSAFPEQDPTATATSTNTATATHTGTPTHSPTITGTPTKTRTPRPTNTPRPPTVTRTATESSGAAASSGGGGGSAIAVTPAGRVSSVLPASTVRLPNTGSGQQAQQVRAGFALLAAGLALASAGIVLSAGLRR